MINIIYWTKHPQIQYYTIWLQKKKIYKKKYGIKRTNSVQYFKTFFPKFPLENYVAKSYLSHSIAYTVSKNCPEAFEMLSKRKR